MKKRKAVTLIELLAAFAIIVIIFAAVVPQFRAIRMSFAGNEAKAEIIQNGRVLAEHIARHLAAAKYIDSVSPSSITFWDNNDIPNQRCYKLAGGYVVFGPVGSEEQLAGPVNRFQISCYDCNIIPATDVNAIRLVRVETDFGAGKTFNSEVFIQTNAQAKAISRGTAFEIGNGPAFEFDTSDCTFPALAKVDATRYLCAYMGTGNDGWAVVLTVNPSTGTITRGTAFEYDISDGRYPALTQIDATRYLCTYYGVSGVGNAIVLTVSGTTITAGTKYQFDTRCLYPALTKIDATRYLCAYSGASNYGTAVVLTVSGTTVTAGTKHQFDTSFGAVPALAQIDSSRYLCAYQGNASNAGCAKVLTVSGTTVTSGARYQYDTYGVAPSLSQIDSTHYLCAYARSGPANAIVLMVSGTTITWGARYQFDASCSYPALSQIDSNRYLCAYAGSGSDGFAVILTVNPATWTITQGTAFEYDTSNGTYPALAQIDVCNYLCVYTGSGSDGWSVVLLNRVKP